MKGEKNIGPFLAFDDGWFRKHQRLLVWLLNAPVIKIWFRWVLRIRKSDCHLNEKINLILPNQFHKNARIVGDKIFATADFRTHWKYSKRIYYAFKWVWWALHFWDWLIADRFLPELSFGLFTLNSYPNQGETGPGCDGFIQRRQDDTYTTPEQLGTTTGGTPPIGQYQKDVYMSTILLGQIIRPYDDLSYYNILGKGFLVFDTSKLPASTSVSGPAYIDVYVTDYLAPVGSGIGYIGLFKATTQNGNTLVDSDFFEVETTELANQLALELATKTISGGTPAQYIDVYYLNRVGYYRFNLNADGKNNITFLGVSKFATHFTYASSFLTGSLTYFVMHKYCSANSIEAEFDPKLVIDYSIPGTNKIQMII
ncbi:MAG: hypothetical protein ACYC56_04280 [Candidatus Aquicultor sp.]